MKVIFGVGNPGDKYKLTRHNVGYEVIDRFASLSNIKMRLQKNWLMGIGSGEFQTSPYYLVKPLSFVNECGIVAKELMAAINFSFSDFLVVVDDFCLPLGTTRMRPKGSSGGHKGVESITYWLESEDFPRLRIGIGPVVGDAVDFVLSKFKDAELRVLDEVIDRAILGIRAFVEEGISRAMDVCNKNNSGINRK